MPTDWALFPWLSPRIFSVTRLSAGTVKFRVRAPASVDAWGASRIFTFACVFVGLRTVRYSWNVTPVYPSAKPQLVLGAVVARVVLLSRRWPVVEIRVMVRVAYTRLGDVTTAATILSFPTS